MSEGPEVRRTADRLEEALAGRVIEAAELRTRAGIAPEIDARLRGARVREVRTHGKHLVIAFSRGVYLHNHMMMFGKWRTYARDAFDAGAARPPPRVRGRRAPRRKVGATVSDVRRDSRVRLILQTSETVAVEFNGPRLQFSLADPAKGDAIQRLGPDGLAKRFASGEARRRLHERSSRKLADLLLDQSFVAGIGNKSKSELLFELGWFPFLRAGDLTSAQETQLLRAIPKMLRRGYEGRGRTRELEPGEAASSWNHRHYVFRRGGRPCWRCGTRIVTDRKSSARVTFYCPRCQPAPTRRPTRESADEQRGEAERSTD